MNEEVTEWKKEWIKNPGFFDSQTPAILPYHLPEEVRELNGPGYLEI